PFSLCSAKCATHSGKSLFNAIERFAQAAVRLWPHAKAGRTALAVIKPGRPALHGFSPGTRSVWTSDFVSGPDEGFATTSAITKSGCVRLAPAVRRFPLSLEVPASARQKLIRYHTLTYALHRSKQSNADLSVDAIFARHAGYGH